MAGPDLSCNGYEDAFVARVNAQGTALEYCGYIGGAGDDTAYTVAVDGQARAWVGGDTTSDESSFPITVGPGLVFRGIWDGYVARVNAGGTALDTCGYLGGDGTESVYAIAVDGQDRACVAGKTSSKETSFPVTVGPDLTYNGGMEDCFVAKVEFAVDFDLASTPDPIIAGQTATFTVSGAQPGTDTWIAYSLTGTGVTPVPSLGITLALARPVQVAAGPAQTDQAGFVSWTLPIPPAARGRIVCIQAVQPGQTSNVLAPLVQ